MLPTGDPLGTVVTMLATPFGRLHSLAIDTAGAGGWLPTGSPPDSTSEGVIDGLPGSVSFPRRKVVVDSPPWGKIVGRCSPDTAIAVAVEDGINHEPLSRSCVAAHRCGPAAGGASGQPIAGLSDTLGYGFGFISFLRSRPPFGTDTKSLRSSADCPRISRWLGTISFWPSKSFGSRTGAESMLLAGTSPVESASPCWVDRRATCSARRREGRLEIRPREKARPVGVRGAEERLQFLARELAVAVAIEPGEHELAGRGRRVAAREIKVGLCECAVAIAIEPRKSASQPGNSLRAIRLSPSRSKRLRVASQSKRVWVTAVRNQPYFGPMASSSRIAVYMSSHSGRSGQAS